MVQIIGGERKPSGLRFWQHEYIWYLDPCRTLPIKVTSPFLVTSARVTAQIASTHMHASGLHLE